MVAGNDGMMSTVDNVAPWTMTVGAFGMDRQFRTPVALGNGVNMFGISPNTFKLEKMYPLMPTTQLKVPDPAPALGYVTGQINPTAAVDPGLVYITQTDYIRFLCHEGHSGTILQLVTDEVIENCSTVGQFRAHDVLNYPSMYVQLEDPNATISATFYRMVTNVGPSDSVYRATVKANEGLNVSVSPSILRFQRPYQRKSFQVTITGKPLGESGAIRSASLEWVDSESVHRVRSPIVASIPEEGRIVFWARLGPKINKRSS
ncbi:hypothetical protein VitviT2T_009062 [Vitis vinifera]|uniref:Subtilisin-like protease fibronectin type-III domain-containing protein n=1 Tax=Vitis vinifera TaxID=29760 RepID=A0ABY9C579_VITVI|nr:hypothetical protein VitviT2T_009062 [Vitis vinifera]